MSKCCEDWPWFRFVLSAPIVIEFVPNWVISPCPVNWIRLLLHRHSDSNHLTLWAAAIMWSYEGWWAIRQLKRKTTRNLCPLRLGIFRACALVTLVVRSDWLGPTIKHILRICLKQWRRTRIDHWSHIRLRRWRQIRWNPRQIGCQYRFRK